MILITYLSKYPLLSTKRLDFNAWLEGHDLVVNGQHKSAEGSAKLKALKVSMNNSRTLFDWTHLG
jgi:hypothetical protein